MGAASGTSVIYGKDATELQMRKLGDLYFMFKLYKHAFNCYHTAKKDFQVSQECVLLLVLLKIQAKNIKFVFGLKKKLLTL